MEWCDYQRHAQGYIIRVSRNLEAARKVAYWTLIAAGAKRVKETHLFSLITDPPPPKRDKAQEITPDELKAIHNRYFNKNKTGAWQSPKKV